MRGELRPICPWNAAVSSRPEDVAKVLCVLLSKMFGPACGLAAKVLAAQTDAQMTSKIMQLLAWAQAYVSVHPLRADGQLRFCDRLLRTGVFTTLVPSSEAKN